MTKRPGNRRVLYALVAWELAMFVIGACLAAGPILEAARANGL